jgi:serine/threonine protein kinase
MTTSVPPQDSVPFLADAPPCRYQRVRPIGKGAYGEAFLVTRMEDGAHYVAKVLDLKAMSEKNRKYAFTEVRCVAACDHPNIVRFIEDHVVGEGEQMIIVMELADAGDLGTQIRNHRVRFSEREAGMLFVQVLLALQHIHSRRMIHRDIKSGNVLLSSTGLVKIGDFGFSQIYDQTVSESVAKTFLGTPYYLAPEMWRGAPYGKKADIWAAGIVLYEMLANRRPFVGQNIPELKQHVLAGRVEAIPGVSQDMHDLVNLVFRQDPAQRPSAVDLLATPLMQHYLTLFLSIVVRDAKIPQTLKDSIAAAVKTAQDEVQAAFTIDPDSADPKYEGPVQKETDGVWKDRFLILTPSELIMTLTPGKEAAPGTERSKRMPISTVTNVVPNTRLDGSGRFVFSVQISNSSNIVLAVQTARERDVWLTKLLRAAGLDN